MGIPVMILGESGSGKSASLRNFKPDEVAILNVASKPLPFRKKMQYIANNANYQRIFASLNKQMLKTYVIDDSQYLMAFDLFDNVNVGGYDKFTKMAVAFQSLIRFISEQMEENRIVYFLHHVDIGADGRLKAKTIGKMLDDKMTVEGLFSIVLLCVNEKGERRFITQSDGGSTAKSPMEMFPYEMDNDLKAVDTRIREYYGLE